MNRLLLAAALATSAFALPLSPAMALPQTVCTTYSEDDTEAPSGVYVDQQGRRWVGFKPDGSAPDSLVASGGSTTICTQNQPQ